jgi:hypothetical protein
MKKEKKIVLEISGGFTFMNDGLPKQVINEPCSQSMEIVG